MTVVRNQNAVLFGTQPQDFRIGNACVQVEFRRALKIYRGLQPFRGTQNVFVQIVVGLKSDLH